MGESETAEAAVTPAEVLDMEADGKEDDGSGSCLHNVYRSACTGFAG